MKWKNFQIKRKANKTQNKADRVKMRNTKVDVTRERNKHGERIKQYKDKAKEQTQKGGTMMNKSYEKQDTDQLEK